MRNFVKMMSVALVLVVSAVSAHAMGPVVKTDKGAYSYGESIKVTFGGAPGVDSDWICIVPAGSPDTEGGDYKYLQKGADSGILTFDPPAPGKYEVRAFYNYYKVSYKVAARSEFTVTGDAAYKDAMEQLMERKLDQGNPLEAKVSQDRGVIYLYREPWSMSAGVDLQVVKSDKTTFILGQTDYYPLVVEPGEHKFQTGTLFETGSKRTVSSREVGNATVKVKPGYVYYLRAKVQPNSAYDNYLDNMPHKEGADALVSFQLKPRN